jgi:excisionase family DNA binding protein
VSTQRADSAARARDKDVDVNPAPNRELPAFDWPSDVMTVAEVSAAVRLTPKTVRQHIRAGRLRSVRFGSRYRVHRADAQAWVETHIVKHDERLSIDQVIARRRSTLAGAPRAARPATSGSGR